VGEVAQIPPEWYPAEQPNRLRRFRRLRRFVMLSSVAYLALVVALGVAFRFADEWWFATLLMFAPGWLFALPLALLVPAAVAVRRRALAALVPAAVLAGAAGGFALPWGQLSDPPRGFRLRVATCNIHYINLNPAPLNGLVADIDPDVLVLQEWDVPDAHAALALRDGPWHIHQTERQTAVVPRVHVTAERFVVVSRFPIRRAANGKNSMSAGGAVARYELETPAGLVTLFSVHLATPREGLGAVIRRDRSAPALIQANSDLRREQSEALAREAAAVTGPVLIVGDFNTPPQSVRFRQTWGWYSDAFSSAGWGWGHTFFTRKAGVRIDHILMGPGWHCERAWVGPSVGSPHHPVIADLVWAPNK
jgi:vancomycin resistance protein VanJ